MNSTAMIAKQFRLQEWADQIKECNNRPHGMTVEEWCDINGITKANYYYRLKRVRQVYLQTMQPAEPETTVVPVPTTVAKVPAITTEPLTADSLEITGNRFSITVTNVTPLELLGKVLKVIGDA